MEESRLVHSGCDSLGRNGECELAEAGEEKSST